jgi:glycosyltransferase involved in cell wall biosynthesis
MKILFVCMGDSIHSIRWINQLDEKFDVSILSINSNIAEKSVYINRKIIIYDIYPILVKRFNTGLSDFILIHVGKVAINIISDFIVNTYLRVNKDFISRQVLKKILLYKPDVIHSLEIQSAGYSVNQAKKMSKTFFPSWIVSNWGSDIYHFGRDPNHAAKIRDVLSNCDYYMCECQRDVKLAKDFGFRGKILSVLPNAGGYNISKYAKYSKVKPSKRRFIMLKGYQGWVGRSQVALEALDSIGGILSEKKLGIILYSTAGNTEVEKKALSIAQKHNLKLKLIPQFTSHEEIIKLHALSRISIGLSMSDGISTSLLESMLTGSFPIQSYTACADEWVVDGHTGILVPPENVAKVKLAILKAIKNDQLVDKAAILNRKTIQGRASYDLVRKQVIEQYNMILSEGSKHL